MRIGVLAVCLAWVIGGCSTMMQQTQRIPLVVVVSADQYRGDYPTKFAAVGGSRGFQRMIREGAWYSHCYVGHASSQTGPGHATMLTGVYANGHGIVSNTFCLDETGECVSCTEDVEHRTSAVWMQHPTVAQALRQSNPDCKVVGVGLKARSVVLMCGEDPTAVVYVNEKTGEFTTSENYPKPSWLDELRTEHSMLQYAGRVWERVIPDGPEAAPDSLPWETPFTNGSVTFPHAIATTDTAKIVRDVLWSPFSMDGLFSATMVAIRREHLGADSVPDLLAVGVSTTDYVGHAYGPDSREVQELYVHTDRFIERLIDSLDAYVGRDRYLLVVTSDHGVTPVPEHTRGQTQPGVPAIDAGRLTSKQIREHINEALNKIYGMTAESQTKSWIAAIHVPNIYVNRKAVTEAGITLAEVESQIVSALATLPGIGIAVRSQDLLDGQCPPGIDTALCSLLQRSVYPGRSGNVLIYPKPYWVFGPATTSHGSPWDYDRWVPLMMLGGGFVGGETSTPVGSADLAPTLARLWQLQFGKADGTVLPGMPGR